ncbi:unnamed protein product [Symbiodinium sp. CCMP2592]|nr:unnamed protein product [Symbiodinium sp. CCMP2592]
MAFPFRCLVFFEACCACYAFSIDAGFTCRASSNEYACAYALDRNVTSAWASDGQAPQWLEARIADGTYATLGSYALTAVIGRPDLAPTAWRLEGVEPGSTQRQILDEAWGKTWQEGTTHIRDLGGHSSWRSYVLTMLEGTGTQVAVAELQLMPKLGYTFEISHWTLCSATCGGGSQERTVVCRGAACFRAAIQCFKDGVSYSDNRCTTGEPPARSRACGTSICACQGGAACTASCSSSSAATADLGCGVLIDGSSLTAWTSAGPAPQWLSFDLGKAGGQDGPGQGKCTALEQSLKPILSVCCLPLLRAAPGEVRELEGFSLTSGECTVCTSLQGPSMISLEARNDENAGWLELRTPFSVGAFWSSGETRRPGPAMVAERSRSRTFKLVIRILSTWPKSVLALQTSQSQSRTIRHSSAPPGLFAPPADYRLVTGSWGACEAVGGAGACGLGVSRRQVTCFDDEDYPHPLENCEDGPETATERGCSVDCPELVVSSASAHPNFFGIMRPAAALVEKL